MGTNYKEGERRVRRLDSVHSTWCNGGIDYEAFSVDLPERRREDTKPVLKCSEGVYRATVLDQNTETN